MLSLGMNINLLSIKIPVLYDELCFHLVLYEKTKNWRTSSLTNINMHRIFIIRKWEGKHLYKFKNWPTTHFLLFVFYFLLKQNRLGNMMFVCSLQSLNILILIGWFKPWSVHAFQLIIKTYDDDDDT